MAALSTLDAGACERLRLSLEALDGVDRAIIDQATDAICLICEPGAEAEPLNLTVWQTLVNQGLDPSAMTIEITSRSGRGARQRVRFIGVERITHEQGVFGVRVTLEWQGKQVTGEASGGTGPAIEQRTAALAAINAVEALLGEEVGLRLVGVKQVRAFDADLIVTSVYRSGPIPQRFVGAVLAPADPLHGASISVLHALNRLMGNFLATTD